MTSHTLAELSDVARVVATRIRQDAANIGIDVRHPRLTMEHHATDLDRLAEKLDAHSSATPLSVLQAHRFIHESAEDAPTCSCGGWEPKTATRDLEEHEEHVAAKLAGHASATGDGPVVWSCAHCGVPIDQFEDDFLWSSLGDFGGTGTGAYTERLWCEEGPGHEHSPNYEPDGEPRPLPTRDELAGAIHPDCTSSPSQCPNWDEALKSADRVLALIPINHELIDLDKVFNGSAA